MERPKILLVSELCDDFRQNIKEIKIVFNKITDENYKMSFIYCYALFEGALNQMARTICYAFPEKVINKDVVCNMSTKELVDLFYSDNAIEEIVNMRIMKKSKNDLIEVISEYSALLNIDIKSLCSFDKYKLIEISRERNNLVHSHTLAEVNGYHNRPNLKYLVKEKAIENIEYIKNLMEEILKECKEHYKKFTFKKLFEDSVKYTLGDCLGKPFYKIEDDRFTLDLVNCKYLSDHLSSGEKFVLGHWMYLYSDSIGNSYGINILQKVSYLDERTIEKIRYIKEFGHKFPFVLDGQHDVK